MIHLAAIPAAAPMYAAAKLHVLLLKMVLQDNSEAFMELFECVAKTSL